MLGLIADDLTGAGDASVQFAKRGWRTIVSWGLTPVQVRGSDPDVVAVSTDSRALANGVAERRTAEALTALMSLGIDRVFLKIDSTMRGSVQGQVAGAVSAWRARYPDARAIVCPAYPRMGRTVQSNRLFVNGEPIDRTSFGRDPVTPVHTSDMAELLPASPHVSVVDAATDGDLMAIAASISVAGPPAIPVGSGGLAEAIAAAWFEHTAPEVRPGISDVLKTHKNSRILLQISSLNPVAHAQAARLKSAFPEIGILSPPLERGDSAAIAARLAEEFAERFDRDDCGILGFVGGDGARATLRRLGANGIRIVDSLIEGIPLGVIVGGRADGLPVFTKAGGFGTEDALARCVERIRREF